MKEMFTACCFISSTAFAIDFDTEWAKFKSEFDRLKTKPVVQEQVKEDKKAPVVKAEELSLVDPKAPERLGNTVSDPVLRQKLQELYKKPDTVVMSTTIR